MKTNIYPLLEYLMHRKVRGPLRLAMAYMVRDEDDIIERNIRFHAHYGVDAFYIVDSGSVDNTVSIIKKLQKEFNIKIYFDANPDRYNQAVWMTHMNIEAKKDGFHFVINNDADEFWLPLKEKNIKDIINPLATNLTVERVNVVPCKNISDMYASTYVTKYAINYPPSIKYPQPFNFLFVGSDAFSVISRPHGLIRVNGGNHSCKHITNRRKLWKNNPYINVQINKEDMLCYHYPIRGRDLFKKRMQIRVNSRKNSVKKKNATQWIWWEDALHDKTPDEIYNMYACSQEKIDILRNLSLIEKDTRIADAFTNIPNI